MFFPLPSPLQFFFGSFLAHLPFVFPLSSYILVFLVLYYHYGIQKAQPWSTGHVLPRCFGHGVSPAGRDPSESFWFQLEICHTFMNNLHENHNHSSMLLILKTFICHFDRGVLNVKQCLLANIWKNATTNICLRWHVIHATILKTKPMKGFQIMTAIWRFCRSSVPWCAVSRWRCFPISARFRCWTDAEEAAQLPKTYPIQLGLAYLLLVRPLRAWGEAASWFRSQWIDVFWCFLVRDWLHSDWSRLAGADYVFFDN